jgi:hypothetical protein
MVAAWPDSVMNGYYYVFAKVRILNPPPNDPTPGNDYTRTSSTIHYNDPDDTISEAITMSVGSSRTGAITPNWDVDMYRFTVSAGQTLSFDIDRPSGSLDSYIRLFNSSGTQLAGNDDGVGPSPEYHNYESYLEYTFASSGTYYLGVSCLGNTGYSPATGLNDSGTGGTGDYTLTVAVVQSQADLYLTSLVVTPSTVTSKSFGGCSFNLCNNGPLPLNAEYVVVDYYLSDDTTFGDADDVRIGDTGMEVSVSPSSCTTITLTPVGLQNMVASWPASVMNGHYYVFAKVRILNPPPNDPNPGNDYTRTSSTIHYNDPDDSLAEAIAVAVGSSRTGTITPNWDVDMYRVTVSAGQSLGFDIDRPGGSLDSYIRLFNSSGTQLASNDDAAGPAPEYHSYESYLEYTFASAGTYYLGVSALGNTSYNPTTGLSDYGSGTVGDYTLTIASAVMPPEIRIEPLALEFSSAGNSVGMLENSAATGPAILLKKRTIATESTVASLAAGLSGHVLIQFETDSQGPAVEALQSIGVRLLESVPRNAVMAQVPRGVNLSGVPGVRWFGKLSAEDKVSAHLSRSLAKGYALVDVFPDVDAPAARRILAEAGSEVIENPHLRANTYLVRCSEDAVATLAETEEVSWIWAASDALIEGQAVHMCPGPMTELGLVPNYVTHDNGWDGPGLGSAALTYHFENGTADIAGDGERVEVVRALQEWTRYVAVGWTETGNRDLNRSFDIGWYTGDHGDGSPFDGAGSVLAHCFYPAPPNSEPIAGDMHFDDAETWRVGSNYDVFSVALHEAGHGLGLAHSDDPDAVMYAIYGGVVTGLQQDDITGIRAIYASSNSRDFTIHNDGQGPLEVASIALNQTAAWVQWAPQAPFTVAAGDSVTVTVSVDFDRAPVGRTSRRLLVYSNDSNESPYPSGVYLTANNSVTLRLNPLVNNGNGTLTLSWSGPGVLQECANPVSPTWIDCPNQGNPQLINASQAQKFYRLRY